MPNEQPFIPPKLNPNRNSLAEVADEIRLLREFLVGAFTIMAESAPRALSSLAEKRESGERLPVTSPGKQVEGKITEHAAVALPNGDGNITYRKYPDGKFDLVLRRGGQVIPLVPKDGE